MDKLIQQKILKAARTLDMGLPRSETLRAVYDMAVHDLGIERVGGFENYKQNPPGWWTLERCKADALLYSTRGEWFKKGNKSYSAAAQNKWLDLCSEHMTGGRKKRGFWTLENCIKDAQRFTSKVSWRKNSVSGYSTAKVNNWMSQCSSHMQSSKEYWTIEQCKADAMRFKHRSQWAKASPKAYDAARTKKWLSVCCKHMTFLQKPNGYWTLDRCREDALLYKTKVEWSRNSAAYAVALTKNWVATCCAHMESKKKPNGYWNRERCIEDAQRFKSITAWQKESCSAYNAARAKGYAEDCTAHMENRSKY